MNIAAVILGHWVGLMIDDESLISAFTAAAQQEGLYSPITLNITVGWLRHCLCFCEPKSLLSLKANDLKDWQQSLGWIPGPSGKLYSVNSVGQAVGSLRRFYRWALSLNLLNADPCKALRTSRGKGKRWQPSTAEARRLLALTSFDTALGMRDRAILGLLFETHILPKTCSLLDLGHLQFDTGALLASGRKRTLHSLSDGLLDDLESYCAHARPQLDLGLSPALFLDVKGHRLQAHGIHARLQVYRQKQKSLSS